MSKAGISWPCSFVYGDNRMHIFWNVYSVIVELITGALMLIGFLSACCMYCNYSDKNQERKEAEMFRKSNV